MEIILQTSTGRIIFSQIQHSSHIQYGWQVQVVGTPQIAYWLWKTVGNHMAEIQSGVPYTEATYEFPTGEKLQIKHLPEVEERD